MTATTTSISRVYRDLGDHALAREEEMQRRGIKTRGYPFQRIVPVSWSPLFIWIASTGGKR